MDLIYTLLAFLFALIVLIAFHELGHYAVARLCNVKVLRFSLGMGKVIFSRRFGADQTEWVISALPLGGYVKMLDLREQGKDSIAPHELQREFTSQSPYKRMAIVAAGPMANFLMAIILFAALFMVGVPEPIAKLAKPAESTQAYEQGIRGGERVVAVNGHPVQLWSEFRWELIEPALEKQSAQVTLIDPTSDRTRTVNLSFNHLSADDLQGNFLGKLGLRLALTQPQLDDIKPGGAAARAKLLKGDTVLEIDGNRIVDGKDLVDAVRASPNKALTFLITRNGARQTITVTPDAVTEEGKHIGKINAEISAMPTMQIRKDGVIAAFEHAIARTWSTSVLIITSLTKMVLGEVSLKNITGPLTIADYAGQTAKIGLMSYLSFLAFISISLGVMNLLPIPVLDGGHLMYYALEIIMGRPVPDRIWEFTQRAGVALLVALMAVALFNDVVRLL
jgi:regulator of sigma E protease